MIGDFLKIGAVIMHPLKDMSNLGVLATLDISLMKIQFSQLMEIRYPHATGGNQTFKINFTKLINDFKYSLGIQLA